MARIATLGLELNADGFVSGARRAQQELRTTSQVGRTAKEEIRAAFDTLGVSFNSLGAQAANMGKGFVEAFAAFSSVREFVRQTTEAQYAQAQLAAAVQSTGGAAGRTVDQLEGLARSLQKTTNFTDDQIERAQALLLTFGNIRGDQLDAATKSVTDLAARMGGDLTSAALQLGKALEDPEQGLLALRRSGVVLSDTQQQLIKDLFDTGHAAEAQATLLDFLKVKMGGAAEAARNTLGGALTGVAHNFQDLFKASGESTSGLVSGLNLIGSALGVLKGYMGAVVTGAEAFFAVFAVSKISGWVGALALARAETAAYAENTVRLAVAQEAQAAVTATQAATERAIAIERVQNAIADKVALSERGAAISALAVADARATVANEALAASEIQVGEAMAATTLAARAAAGASSLFSGALALVGGLPGLAVIATVVALKLAFDQHGAAAKRAADDLNNYRSALAGVSAEAQRAQVAADEALLKTIQSQKAAVQAQINALPANAPRAFATGAPSNALAGLTDTGTQYEQLQGKLRGLNDAEAALKGQLGVVNQSLSAQGETAGQVAEKFKALLAQRQTDVDALKVLNDNYSRSDYALKLIAIDQDALKKKAEDAKTYHGAELQQVNAITDALTQQQRRAATLAVIKEQAQDVRAYTAQNAALVQAAKYQDDLATATNAASLAQQTAQASLAHLVDTIGIGNKSAADYVTATTAIATANAVAVAASRDSATAIEHQRIAQDAATQSQAAYVDFQKAIVGATALEIAAAQKKYDATIVAIQQQQDLRDATADATNAVQHQGDAFAAIASQTAFVDTITAQIDATNRDAQAILREADARKQGQAATDALAVSLAGENAVRALAIQAAKDHATITDDLIAKVRASAESHEKASLALAHATQEEKQFADVSKNFVRSLQGDVGSFFTNLFDGGTNAARSFWDSFKSLALKTFGELAAKDLMQSVIQGARGQGALGGLLGGFGSPATGAPSSSQFGVDAGTGVSDFTGTGNTAGGGFNVGVFAAATAGIFTVTNGLNHLLGVTVPTAASLKQFADNVIAIQKSLTAYQLSVGGSSVAQQLAQNQASADSLRQNIESTYGGRRNQGVREELLGQVGQAQAQGIQKITEAFFNSVRDGYNASLGPAGAYQNQLDAAAQKYIDDTKAAKDLGASQDQLDKISQTYTNTVNTLTAAYKENLAQTQLALDARLAAAQGDTVAAAAIQRRAEEEKQLFDAQQQGYTAAQIDELKHVQALEDEAAAAAKAAAAVQAFRDATNTLAKNLAAGPGGTAASAAAANLQPLLDKQATDTATAAASAQKYAEDLAHGADAATLAADRQQFLTDTTVAMGDAAAIAAQQFQDAVAAIQQGTSDIENAVAGGFITGAAGIAAERQQFGFTGLSDTQIRALYTDPTQGGLTNEQRERNREIDQFLKDEAQWGPQLADAAQSLAQGGTGAAGSAERTAISSAAGNLTEITGNRMADYLSTLNIHAVEIRDAILGRASPLGGAFIGPTTNPFGPTPTLPVVPDLSMLSRSLDSLASSLSTNQAAGGTKRIDVTVTIRDQTTRADIRKQLRDEIDEELAAVFFDKQRRAGENTVIGG